MYLILKILIGIPWYNLSYTAKCHRLDTYRKGKRKVSSAPVGQLVESARLERVRWGFESLQEHQLKEVV